MSVKATFIKVMIQFDVSRSLAARIYDVLGEAGCIASNTPNAHSKKASQIVYFPESPDELAEEMFQKDLLQSQQPGVRACHNYYCFSRYASEQHGSVSKKRAKLATEDGRASNTSAKAKR